MLLESHQLPVLISITSDTDLRTTGNGGHVQSASGYDIIFTDASGTVLDHEVERYTANTGELVAWVRVPTLSYSSNTTLYLYYGNSGISTSQENKTGVWDDNYKGVWHLKETGLNGTTGEVKDSTSQNNGVGQPSSPSYTGPTGGATGIANSAFNFPSGDVAGGAYVNCGNNTSLRITGNLTIEAWVKPGVINMYMGIAGKNYNTGNPSGYALAKTDTNYYRFLVGNGSAFSLVDSNSTYTDTNWHHIVGVVSSGTDYLYLDGVLQSATGSYPTTDSGYNAFIGRQYSNYDQRYWDGIIDEVRISNLGRNACWIQTEFNNQNSPSTFYSKGIEQDLSSTVSLADHAAGQKGDKFTGASSVSGAELFAFKLTNNTASTVTATQVQFPLSSVTGIVQGDFANLALYVDANNDGTIGGGENTTVGGSGVVNAGVTTLTFSTSFTIAASTTVNYILKGDVNNLVGGDTVTLALGTGNVMLQSGTMGGTAAISVTHTADSVDLTEIHARWRNDDGGETYTGTGADGSVSISTSKNINTAVLGSTHSTNPDGIVTAVTANPTGTAISVSSTTGFAAGDEILLINLQGAAGNTADVGNYEFLIVSAVPDGTTFNLASVVTKSYDGSNFANQKVIVQRVPQWTNVTIANGGTLTANAWGGTSGGVLVFRATGTVNVQAGGTISAIGLGYQGGAGVTGNHGGTNGESYDGTVGAGGVSNSTGTSGGGSGDANTNKGTQTSRGGGGGGGYGGGGGGAAAAPTATTAGEGAAGVNGGGRGRRRRRLHEHRPGRKCRVGGQRPQGRGGRLRRDDRARRRGVRYYTRRRWRRRRRRHLWHGQPHHAFLRLGRRRWRRLGNHRRRLCPERRERRRRYLHHRQHRDRRRLDHQ